MHDAIASIAIETLRIDSSNIIRSYSIIHCQVSAQHVKDAKYYSDSMENSEFYLNR